MRGCRRRSEGGECYRVRSTPCQHSLQLKHDPIVEAHSLSRSYLPMMLTSALLRMKLHPRYQPLSNAGWQEDKHDLGTIK